MVQNFLPGCVGWLGGSVFGVIGEEETCLVMVGGGVLDIVKCSQKRVCRLLHLR